MRRRHAVGAALVATTASIATGLGLYPVLRRRDRLLRRAVLAITASHYDLIAVLGKLTELRGGDTAGHNLRVTLYALLFAESLALPPEAVVRTVKGALLHDVGKLVVPDSVLRKPGPLTPEERAEMATHVVRGAAVVRQSRFLCEAVPIVAAHHEHFDGSGYPHGLKGDAIPREARLLALIDVFDALTSPRVYKPALGLAEALATMAAERGSHFDPELFDRFAAIAPGLLETVPADEAAQRAMLMQRMRPYLDRALLGQPLPPGRGGADPV
jgi:putative nucleotidyltransferase with HDIG domain